MFFSSVSLFLSGWPGLYQKGTYQRWFAFDKFSQSVGIVNIPFWKKASVVVLNVTNWHRPQVKRPGPKAKKAIAASLLKPQKTTTAAWQKLWVRNTEPRKLLRTHLNHIRQKQMNSWHFLSCLFHGGILAGAVVFRSMWCIIASDPIIFSLRSCISKKHKNGKVPVHMCNMHATAFKILQYPRIVQVYFANIVRFGPLI